MKKFVKFLIFLVSIVVVVSIGLTTYYFMRNDEIITVGTKELYCNAGDTISLDALKIKVKKASKKTKFNYNAGGEEVENFIRYDSKLGYYVVSNDNGGDVVLVISTTNSKYKTFTVNVHIGDGSVANPYYVFNETDLNNIGKTYRLDQSFSLMSDIVLTNDFSPIGYSDTTGTWAGFSGNFYGNGHKISGLNVTTDMVNAGLFSSINTNGYVENLVIDDASLNGAFDNSGALAGVVDGQVKKVQVTNSSIVNTKEGSSTGAFAGVISGSVKMSCVNKTYVTVGSSDAVLTSAVAGGFAGVVDKATIQACYDESVNIFMNSNGSVGGFVGKFVITDSLGSIQQSYASVTCVATNFGAFVGNIDSSAVSADGNILKFLIGNITVTGKSASNDADVVNSYDATLFVNSAYAGHNVFFDEDASLYMIRGFENTSKMIEANDYVFYTINKVKTLWDTEYVWKTHNNALPELRMGAVEPTSPDGAYFRRNLDEKIVDNSVSFVEMFSTNKQNEVIHLTEDVDLSSVNWTPVGLTNVSLDGLKADGSNVKIIVNLKNAKDDCLGLFTVLHNCSISNIDIEVIGISADAQVFGALAGTIRAVAGETSSINNVNVIYSTTLSTTHSVAGGLVGYANQTTITNCSVTGFDVTESSNVNMLGGIAGDLTTSRIQSSSVNATLNGKELIGGVVALSNDGSVIANNGTVVINYTKSFKGAKLGGAVAENKNNALVDGNKLNVTINVVNANEVLYVGGVAGSNESTISNTKVTGNGISIARNITAKVYVGGVVATNGGSIANTYNLMNSIGAAVTDEILNTNFYVGGIAAINTGSITRSIAGSDLRGSYVGGVVVEMKEGKTAVIDQVLVGKYSYDSETGKYTISENNLIADKYVAGIVFDFRAGIITNVQTKSKIEGTTNDARVSMVVLIFPQGAELSNCTIDSSLVGSGHFYTETWVDFENYANKAEFDFPATTTSDGRFNIYVGASAGKMTSVVISMLNDGADKAMVSLAVVNNGITGLIYYGDSYNDENYVLRVYDSNEFNYEGNQNIIYGHSNATINGGDKTTTKPMTFEIGESEDCAWIKDNGIALNFLTIVK